MGCFNQPPHPKVSSKIVQSIEMDGLEDYVDPPNVTDAQSERDAAELQLKIKDSNLEMQRKTAQINHLEKRVQEDRISTIAKAKENSTNPDGLSSVRTGFAAMENRKTAFEDQKKKLQKELAEEEGKSAKFQQELDDICRT